MEKTSHSQSGTPSGSISKSTPDLAERISKMDPEVKIQHKSNMKHFKASLVPAFYIFFVPIYVILFFYAFSLLD